ncbi:MAG: lipocalin-like domain-containing protein [Pseudomonadota bacterium]
MKPLIVCLAWLCAWGAAAADGYPPVQPGRELRFPEDHGSHPAYRIEWWYFTGWLRDGQGREYGFQVTFFRNRPRVAEDNPSAFAPRQLLFAHAALAEPAHDRLRHDQRAARAGFGLAQAAEGDTDVHIGDWSLQRTEGDFVARVAAREFRLELRFRPTQPVLLQGDRGYSRKGKQVQQASYYYSLPHLAVSGSISIDGEARQVSGTAWMDHEWSSELLAREASGWDWVGINLNDGAALMAFRIRDEQGGTLWAGGALRGRDGATRILAPNEVHFEARRRWRSPRSGATYPVALRLRAGDLVVDLEPLMDDQELDARRSTGTIYWEGAVRAWRDGVETGRGYLELTGYWKRLRL